MKNTKKLMVFFVTVLTVVGLCMSSALACTMVYVGKGLTGENGSAYMARSEDYSNSYNKIAYVSEHGLHKAGEVYNGCYGFTHEFTHDSYAYTAVRDDNLSGVCPNCGQSHDHTPMEEAGSNEMGVSVSAMVTLSWNGKFKDVDPMVRGGMCESDMTTILLSEAATAKEGVELLMKIYDTQGAEERSGVLIGDRNEIWYVENYTGHEYIGVKLSDNMIAISPNMGAIGVIDLDDKENVVHSANVIDTAVKAGTFVGSQKANIIDFRASYSNTSINARMINGLNYFLGEDKFDSSNTTSEDFTISNVDGEIVAPYTAIKTNRELTTKDLVDFYKVDSIGNTSNLEWHIFEINPMKEDDNVTIEWLGMEHGQYTVAIPYFPAYTTEMYEGYTVGGLGKTSKNQAAVPFGATGFYMGSNGKFTVLPNDWDKGYYWSVDALSNYALSSLCTDDERAMIKNELAKMQEKCYKAAAEMEKKLPTIGDPEEKAKVATEMSRSLAKEAHELTLKLYFEIVKPEVTADIKDVDATKWYYPAVRYAYANGIMVGTNDDAFEPETNVSRAMFAQLLYHLEGEPAVEGESVFTDVAADMWYTNAVIWAEQKGLIAGFGDGTFRPDDDITREQMAVLLCEYAKFKGKEVAAENTLTFTDADSIGAWAVPAVQWAVKEGIMAGMGNNTFAPKGIATRAQVAQLIYAFLTK